MRRLTNTTLRILPLALCAIPCAFGYIGETFNSSDTPPQKIQITHADATGLQFYLNNLVVAGVKSSLSGTTVITANSKPAIAIESAMAAWNSVGASSINFAALQTTTAAHDSTDCKNVISIAATAADLAVLGFVSVNSPGVVAVTANSYIQSAGSVCGGSTSVPAGTIVDSDIMMNPYVSLSTDGSPDTRDVQAVITHEFGHVFGMNHSSLLGATMYPYAATYQRHLSWDEKAFAATYYPSGKTTLGTISGTVTLGSNPVKYGLVTLTDVTPGGGKVICTLTAADGTYSAQVPLGIYNVYAEPFNSFIGPLNVYSLTTNTGALDPTQITTAFGATFSGGNSTSPPVFTIGTAGASATANIAVTSGATTLAPPFYGIGKAGGSGDITSFSTVNGAISLIAGKSYDLAFSGAGIDATVIVAFIGTNVTLVGTPHVDAGGGTVNGNPIVRQTINIGSQTNATLGTLWIVKGATILPFSGILDLEPMVPNINNVQDAESGRISMTSGQWVAIYGNNLANNTRFWTANTDFTGGVTIGSPLPSVLDGISVTVNGTPASVYYISPTQVNILTPSNLTNGNATVVLSNNTTASQTFTSTVVTASPSFFYYPEGAVNYPLAIHLTPPYNYVGDPAALSIAEKAHPGETIEMFANGLAAAPGGSIVAVAQYPQQVTVSAGATPLTVSAPYLVSAGEFQINVTLPANIPAGNYTLTMTVPGGTTVGSGISVVLPVGP